ncbi:hypothetical protein E5S69_31555 [Cupriavidus necator]|uniref:hypothetical protein n=1 Tax=Cupriavidus necator TaxID=106590 RepID=UPI00148FD899|nr:hypothetical protein [Cupriavidus necator]NOV28024.1 hypothetical protein [Cupriavidus necator]
MIGAFIGIATAAAHAAEARRIADERRRQAYGRYEREAQEWADSQAGVIDIPAEDVRVIDDVKLIGGGE